MSRALSSEQTIFIRVPEAAELLGLPVKTVYTMIHRADFPAFRNGRTVLIHRAKLEEWARAQVNTAFINTTKRKGQSS